jgi:transposase-like protein
MTDHKNKNDNNSLGRGTRRQHFNIEFKRKALQMMHTSGKSVTEIASMMNVDHSVLYRWKQKYKQEFLGETAPRLNNSLEMREIGLIKRDIYTIKQNLEILRKIMEKAFKTMYLSKQEYPFKDIQEL